MKIENFLDNKKQHAVNVFSVLTSNFLMNFCPQKRRVSIHLAQNRHGGNSQFHGKL